MPDLDRFDADLGHDAAEIKALHPGGPKRWRMLIEQTVSLHNAPSASRRRSVGSSRSPSAPVKFMHRLQAFHEAGTTVGAEIAQATGMTNGLEVTDDVIRSSASTGVPAREHPRQPGPGS